MGLGILQNRAMSRPLLASGLFARWRKWWIHRIGGPLSREDYNTFRTACNIGTQGRLSGSLWPSLGLAQRHTWEGGTGPQRRTGPRLMGSLWIGPFFSPCKERQKIERNCRVRESEEREIPLPGADDNTQWTTAEKLKQFESLLLITNRLVSHKLVWASLNSRGIQAYTSYKTISTAGPEKRICKWD